MQSVILNGFEVLFMENVIHGLITLFPFLHDVLYTLCYWYISLYGDNWYFMISIPSGVLSFCIAQTIDFYIPTSEEDRRSAQIRPMRIDDRGEDLSRNCSVEHVIGGTFLWPLYYLILGCVLFVVCVTSLSEMELKRKII